MTDDVSEYWDRRAREATGALDATTSDIWLRELEVATITDALGELALGDVPSIVDLGCGDGHTAVRIAAAFPRYRVTGLDNSPAMLERAQARLADHPALGKRVRFVEGDIADLPAAFGNEHFDVALTDRCLINLDSTDRQYGAIHGIARQLTGGGVYLAIENFVEGQDAMNAARRAVGVEEIPIRWHNRYFREDEFSAACGKLFGSLEYREFSSSYYFATRVIYSALCKRQGIEPDYDHEIHRLAIKLPWSGRFSPIRLAILRQPKPA